VLLIESNGMWSNAQYMQLAIKKHRVLQR